MRINVNELRGEETASESSSDSDQDYVLSADIDKEFDISNQEKDSQNNTKLNKIIVEINKKIEAEEPVDLSKYPPLFIVNYRGVHYFNQFFDQTKRRATRSLIHNHQFHHSIYSSAVYELANLAVGEIIDTPEKKLAIANARKQLQASFRNIETVPASENAWWGKDRAHDLAIHQHYHRYVNAYEEFRKESAEKRHEVYKYFKNTKNPYISTADSPRHAILYALGGKATMEHGCLRPRYIKGRAKHPKTGYVQIIFHQLHEISNKKPLFLSSLHAANKIDINSRVLNERETTYKTSISGRHVAYTKSIRFPAFNKPYHEKFHKKKYGLEKRSYDAFKKVLTNSSSTTTTLLDTLTNHYETQLENKAHQLARKAGGYIVYMGLDGRLASVLTTTLDISTVRNNTSKNPQLDNFDNNIALYQNTSISNIDSDDDLVMPPSQPHRTREELHPLISLAKSPINQLEQMATGLGYQCHDVPGDGKCFYHAILHQLKDVFNIEKFQDTTITDLKKITANELRSGKYKGFLAAQDPQTASELVNGWADNVAIQALANALAIDIRIIRSDGSVPTLITAVNPTHTVTLGYVVGLHYISLISHSSTNNISNINQHLSRDKDQNLRRNYQTVGLFKSNLPAATQDTITGSAKLLPETNAPNHVAAVSTTLAKPQVDNHSLRPSLQP